MIGDGGDGTHGAGENLHRFPTNTGGFFRINPNPKPHLILLSSAETQGSDFRRQQVLEKKIAW